MQFKYNIGHYTSLLPNHIYLEDVIDQLAQHGISKAQFLKDKSIEVETDDIIPKERLSIYANVLGVSIESLKNA